MEKFEIKNGEWYLCISDVVMEDGVLAYVKDKIYPSERDGCITDMQGDKRHEWSFGEIDNAALFFRPARYDEKLTILSDADKATWLRNERNIHINIDWRVAQQDYEVHVIDSSNRMHNIGTHATYESALDLAITFVFSTLVNE